MSEALSMAFTEQVEHRRNGEQVPSETVSISDGDAKLSVRLAGGYITEAILSDEGEPVSMLYCDPAIQASDSPTQPSKIDASHDMSPAGFCDDIGGQHGVYRWADFEVTHQDPRHVTMEAMTPKEFLGMQKSFSLDDNGLTIITKLSNQTDDVVDTSLGHHLYWNMHPENEERPQVVVPSAGQPPLQDPEVYEAVMNGDARYWSAYDSKVAMVTLPGVGRFFMRSSAHLTGPDGQRHEQQVGMLLWRRPGTNSICFEPVVGNENLVDQPICPSGEVPNHQLIIATGAAVTLKTIISVIEAA